MKIDNTSDEKASDLDIALEHGLASGEFIKNGRMISERSLAAKLKVPRTRLRRALARMERNGMIFRRQGQGTFVLPPPLPHAPRIRRLAASATPRHIMEVRLEIEPALAAFAAERAPPDELRQLEGLCFAAKDQSSAEAFESADDVFHYKIAQMANNPLFLSIYEEIRAVRREAAWINTSTHQGSTTLLKDSFAQHQQICEAITKRDANRAASAMERHLMYVLNSRVHMKWQKI